MHGNSRPKGCSWRVRFFSVALRFSDVLRANLKGAEKKRTLKTPFWTTVSLHAAFSALARSDKYRAIWGIATIVLQYRAISLTAVIVLL